MNRRRVTKWYFTLLFFAFALLVLYFLLFTAGIRREISASVTQNAIATTKMELAAQITPLRNNFHLLYQLAKADLFRDFDMQDYNRILIPFLNNLPQLHAISIADSTGFMYYLQKSDSAFTLRLRSAPGYAGEVEFALDRDGMRQSRRTLRSDDKVNRRSWYIGARDSVAFGEIYTSPVYRFLASGEYGLTLSAAWGDNTGKTAVLAFAIRLDDLLTFVRQLAVGDSGQAFLLTAKRTPLAVSGNDTLYRNTLHAAITNWQAHDFHEGMPFSFFSSGRLWWADFRSLQQRSGFIGIILPENEISDDVAARNWRWLGALLAIFILLALTGLWLLRRLPEKSTETPLLLLSIDEFSSAFSAVGFDTYVNSFGPADISVFGATGILGSYSLSHDPTMVGFLGITSNDPITSIRWTTTNGRTIGTGVDNIGSAQ
jgi:hypothetical protein